MIESITKIIIQWKLFKLPVDGCSCCHVHLKTEYIPKRRFSSAPLSCSGKLSREKNPFERWTKDL